MKKLVSIAALLLVAACSQDAGMNQNTTNVSAKDLQHHNYILVAIDGKAYKTPKNAMSPNIEFGEKLNITGSMCNNFFGQGQLKNNVLSAKGVGMTRKFCTDKTLNGLDQKIGQLLDGSATVALKDNGQFLVLSNDQTILEFKLKDFVN